MNEGKYLAIDCEMVKVGNDESRLARVSIVNFFGAVLLDVFVQQTEYVTDYLTPISGIRTKDLKGPNAKPFEDVQGAVQALLPKGTNLVGHAVHNDLKALKITHPPSFTHDTQRASSTPTVKHPKLKAIVKQELDIEIQQGEHDSVTDARAAMALFRVRKTQSKTPVPRKQLKGKKGKVAKEEQEEDEEEFAGISSLSGPTRSVATDERKQRVKAAQQTRVAKGERKVGKGPRPTSKSKGAADKRFGTKGGGGWWSTL